MVFVLKVLVLMVLVFVLRYFEKDYISQSKPKFKTKTSKPVLVLVHAYFL